MKFFLLSDNIDTQIGMRLAGVEGVVLHETDEFRLAFDKALSDKEIAVLLITEKLAALDPDYIKEQKLSHHLPLIVEIPDRHGSNRNPNYILNYLKQAIGI